MEEHIEDKEVKFKIQSQKLSLIQLKSTLGLAANLAIRIKETENDMREFREIVLGELKKNETFSKETETKFLELEEKIKKKNKTFSLINNLNLSGISSHLTGIDVGD